MKRLIFGILATLTTATAFANDSIPFVDKSRPNRVISISIEVGEGAFTQIQNYADAIGGMSDFTLTPGNRFSVGATAVMPVRKWFGIGTGAHFVAANWYWNGVVVGSGDTSINAISTSNRMYTLNIPMFLNFTFNIARNVRWHNEGGMFLSLALDGTQKTRQFSSYTNVLGQTQVTERSVSRKYFNDDNAVVNGNKGTDYGLHIGTGLQFGNHLSLKCILQCGLRNTAINFGVLDIKNHSVAVDFRAGYIF